MTRLEPDQKVDESKPTEAEQAEPKQAEPTEAEPAGPTEAGQATKPRVVMPEDPDFATDAEGDQALVARAEPFRPVRSVVWALVLGVAAAIGWALITVLTGYQLGLIAIVVGALAGVGAAKGGRSKQAQVVGAAAAAFAYFLGQGITVIALLAQQGPVPDEASSSADSPEPVASASLASDTSAVESMETQPVDSAPAEPVGIVAAFGLLFVALLQDTFTSLGVLFLAIAVWEGWRIPRPQA